MFALRTLCLLGVAGLASGCAEASGASSPFDPATAFPAATGSERAVLPSMSPTMQGGPEPLPLDGSSFYYHVDGNRLRLTPSLSWIAVRFVPSDPAIQSAALQGSIAGPLEGGRRLPNSPLDLLPVRKGLSTSQLIEGINALRLQRSSFLLVNPVFQSGDAEMVLTDEFIAAFPADKGKEAIETLNSARGVEIVDALLGQENTYVLKVGERAGLDALGMANLYQEDGLASYAAPNFLRLMASP